MSHTDAPPAEATAAQAERDRRNLFALIDERLAQPEGAALFRQQMAALVQTDLQAAVSTVHANGVTNPYKPTEIKVGQPKNFNGDVTIGKQWATSVQTYLYLNQEIYNTDEKKIIFTLSFMTEGTAASWAHQKSASALATIGGNYVGWGSWEQFKVDFDKSFDYGDHALRARQKLQNLKQTGSVDEFISEFRTLWGLSGISENAALIGYFQTGIKAPLMRQIFAMECVPSTIEGWIKKAALFDSNARMANAVARGNTTYTPTPHYQNKYKPYHGAKPRDPNGMDVDRITLSSEEKDRYFREALCFECGQKGHRAAVCRNRQGSSRPRFNPPRANIRATDTKEDPKGKAIAIKGLLEGMTEEGKAATFKTLGEDVDF